MRLSSILCALGIVTLTTVVGAGPKKEIPKGYAFNVKVVAEIYRAKIDTETHKITSSETVPFGEWTQVVTKNEDAVLAKKDVNTNVGFVSSFQPGKVPQITTRVAVGSDVSMATASCSITPDALYATTRCIMEKADDKTLAMSCLKIIVGCQLAEKKIESSKELRDGAVES